MFVTYETNYNAPIRSVGFYDMFILDLNDGAAHEIARKFETNFL